MTAAAIPTIAHPALALIEQRRAANQFDAAHLLPHETIDTLVRLATQAPTAYHLQNWRFIAVVSPAAKARLRALAWNQPKVEAAAVTFIVCGVLPDAATLPARLQPFVDAGHMPPEMPAQWQAAAHGQYTNPQAARDEAVRSASLGAATLMLAAEALGLASGPMGGFEPDEVAYAFGLAANELPVMLIALGQASAGNWPQKPRRPLAEVLQKV